MIDTDELCSKLVNGVHTDLGQAALIKTAVQRLRELELEVILLQQEQKPEKLTGSEALFGFMGWLTTREMEVTFGSHHPAGTAVQLIKGFVDSNGLQEPRVGWENNLVHPPAKGEWENT